ncbi:MAG: BatA domain-containing protein, partial [Candidatus Brocadiae bacterium]|nr:BatA domain-containing protein [Candidatus Brocadiia bacterium]
MWRIGFTHLGALWLGAAAVLPLIIHFLWRQRPKVIRFPAVRFIRLSQRKSFRRTR